MRQTDRALALSSVARRFQVSRKTILRWVKSGKLKGFRTLGGHYRVWSSDLEQFLRKSGVEAESDRDPAASPASVFIIDDDVEYHEPLRMIIEQNFVPTVVRTYANGYRALIDIGRYRPPIILLDIRMPHIDGFEVMKAIQAMDGGYRPRILIISGYIDGTTEQALAGTIACGHLAKPFTAAALITALSGLGLQPLAASSLSTQASPPGEQAFKGK